jgi:two-component system chemotaxis sensor kinase CheA
VQLGEAILPLAGLDRVPEDGGKVRLFRLSDGHAEVGLAFREVIDMAELDETVLPAIAPGEVEGVTLIGGEPAELVDVHWLFARAGGGAATQERTMVCRLPGDDPWMQHMLRPIVEAAGYRVVSDESDEAADLVIAAKGQALPANDEGARTIWLRAEPDARKNDKSIYRYDRAGLMMALTAGGGTK